MMKILFVADGRSSIALNWIDYFLARGDEVHLVSTFDCTPCVKFDSVKIVPVAFSQFKNAQDERIEKGAFTGIFWSSSLVKLRTSIRRILSPLSIPKSATQLEGMITDLKPDLVHAMRIPFEGILTAKALQNHMEIPLVVSVWGNDFTLHAGATPWMSRYTRLTLARADGLHVDCLRDLHLANKWGFSEEKQSLLVPGNGGIKTGVFFPVEGDPESREKIVINPRGVRSYIRNDTFFASIPKILATHPETRFICPGMAGEAEVEDWISKYGINQAVKLLPSQSRSEMANLFRSAVVAVSPSTHDGTPNTLLEAMACGCYPVAGDLDSIREWIIPGENGSLVDPADPKAFAEAVSDALENVEMRQKAAIINHETIMERAEYQASMARAVEFYETILGQSAREVEDLPQDC